MKDTRSPHARYAPAGSDGIGHLTLTRPEKLNAADDHSVDDLDRAATLTGRDETPEVNSGVSLHSLCGGERGHLER